MIPAAPARSGVFAAFLTAMVAACGGSLASTEATGSLLPTSSVSTASTGAPGVAFDCIISSPSRFQDDQTPVIIDIEGVTEVECRARLQGEKAADAFYHTHPETLLDQPPGGEPRCSEVVQGHRETVWGTGMATIYCRTIIFMATGSFPPEFR